MAVTLRGRPFARGLVVSLTGLTKVTCLLSCRLSLTAVPAPLVGHQRGGVVQRASQANQHGHSQQVPGPLGFFLFHFSFRD